MAVPRTYLDHNATAPLRPQARAAMIDALDLVGNASSVHAEGRSARGVIEDAREQVAALVGAKPEEIVFTSGATEANNWAIRAGWASIFVGATEHESVLAPARICGVELVEIPCWSSGVARLEKVTEHIASLTASPVRTLISLQLANSETGVLQPVGQLAEYARARGLHLHTDAVQAIGRIPVDFRTLGVDLMSISAHKLGGPKGVGALVVRDELHLPALLMGGGQERRRRPGTENIAAIAGFGAAARAARNDLDDWQRVETLLCELEDGIRRLTPAATVVGGDAPEKLPNTSCIALPGHDAATLLIKLDLAGIAVSAGSACSSGKIGASHVLAAMGLPDEIARSAIRLSLGYSSTRADIDRFLAAWSAIHRGDVKPCGTDISARAEELKNPNRRRVMASDPQGRTLSQAGE